MSMIAMFHHPRDFPSGSVPSIAFEIFVRGSFFRVAQTGCVNVQITECAVWLLHSRPIQLPDQCQTRSAAFRGSKDDRNVRRVLELRPRVCLQLGRDESCFREFHRCSRQFPRYVNLGTSCGETYNLLNARNSHSRRRCCRR